MFSSNHGNIHFYGVMLERVGCSNVPTVLTVLYSTEGVLYNVLVW